MSIFVTKEDLVSVVSKNVDVLLSFISLPEDVKDTEANRILYLKNTGGYVQYPDGDYDGVSNTTLADWSEAAFLREMLSYRLELMDSLVIPSIREGETERDPSDPEVRDFILPRLIHCFTAYLALIASRTLYNADPRRPITTKDQLVDEVLRDLHIDSDPWDIEYISRESKYKITLVGDDEKLTLLYLKYFITYIGYTGDEITGYTLRLLLLILSIGHTDMNSIYSVYDGMLNNHKEVQEEASKVEEDIEQLQEEVKSTLSEKDSALNFIAGMLMNAVKVSNLDITEEDLDKLKSRTLEGIKTLKENI